jgi:hypothetical protein
VYIEEEQTTQLPKEKVQKDKQRSTKHTHINYRSSNTNPIKIPIWIVRGEHVLYISQSETRMPVVAMLFVHSKWNEECVYRFFYTSYLQWMVPNDQVVSEEKAEMWKVYRWRIDYGHQVMVKEHMIWIRWTKRSFW